MARARSGGGTPGSIWGLVIFGAGFFICLILAILFYTRVETAEQEAQEARAELNQVISSSDENNPTLARLTAEGSGTTVNRLIANVGDLEAEIVRLQSQLVDANDRLATTQTQLETAQSQNESNQASLQQASQSRQQLAGELRGQVQSLTSTVNSISAENDRLKGLVDTSIEEVDQTYRSQIESLQTQLREQENQGAQLSRTIEDLQYQLSILTGTAPVPSAVASADATIVSQLPEQNKVYLDIGRNDGLQPGMAFQVFDPDTLVRLEGEDLEEGKAVVDIINVNDTTSVGRIVTTEGNVQVRNGDKLVNVVFEPGRVYTFHLFGQFDLDYDESPDDGGLEQVENMVRRFNGRLADELSFSTDYLVLGVEPELPTRPDDELDLIQMKEYRVQLENFNAYQGRITQARELGIPVLNQNRFFNLVGYFER